MSRKLASIKEISDLVPIEGKDRIELAIIDGWQIIVKKGEYRIGDKTIFVEIDSILPEKEEFEFLRSKKFRIKTMKMGGVLSQGICFPLSILPEGKYELDQDIADLIGIKKYEPNEDNRESRQKEVENKYKNPAILWLLRFKIFRNLLLTPKKNKGFPTFISKTDETRIQNIPNILKNKDVKYIVREKVDGQSGTFFLQRKKVGRIFKKEIFEFGVCSRNLRLWNENDSSYWSVAKKYKIEQILKELIGNNEFVAIQGECISSKVQGNKYKVKDPDLYIFNLIYPFGKIPCLEGEEILSTYGLKWCPLIEKDFILSNSVNEILDYSTGQSKLHNTLREGIVLRNYKKNISFKAVSPDFLIKHNE